LLARKAKIVEELQSYQFKIDKKINSLAQEVNKEVAKYKEICDDDAHLFLQRLQNLELFKPI
jgi:hypothetical protein